MISPGLGSSLPPSPSPGTQGAERPDLAQDRGECRGEQRREPRAAGGWTAVLERRGSAARAARRAEQRCMATDCTVVAARTACSLAPPTSRHRLGRQVSDGMWARQRHCPSTACAPSAHVPGRPDAHFLFHCLGPIESGRRQKGVVSTSSGQIAASCPDRVRRTSLRSSGAGRRPCSAPPASPRLGNWTRSNSSLVVCFRKKVAREQRGTVFLARGRGGIVAADLEGHAKRASPDSWRAVMKDAISPSGVWSDLRFLPQRECNFAMDGRASEDVGASSNISGTPLKARHTRRLT